MRVTVCVLVALLSACNAKWETLDVDGDGVTVAAGDCWEGQPGDGSEGVYPGAAEVWYDGVDQNCDGGSDYDADGDGHDALGISQPDGTMGDDCWDDPGTTPAGYLAVPGAVQLAANEVYPGELEVWYDGIDGDCSGGSDFDQDLDGEDDANHPQVDGHTGQDCYDEVDPDCILLDGSEPDCSYPLSGVLVGTPFGPAEIHPGVSDVPYDGTDQDCGENSDYDADGDGFDRADECDDADATIFPNGKTQIWYNGIDENCSGNDGDQDGDGYYAADYPFPELIPPDYVGFSDDCWDDPADAADWRAINGFTDPTGPSRVHPGAYDEWYDGLDENCAGDDDFDADHDTHNTEVWPDRVGGYGDDCDDARGDMYPGAVDTWYDGDDSDCAGNDDFDQDYDTYASDGYGGGDCDDGNDAVHPNRDELCSTVDDDNCDGGTNDVDATGCAVFYSDLDGDSHGGPNEQCTCVEEGAYVYTVSDDCDDANPAAYPSAPETTGNEVDEDCNRGEICFVDADNDEFRTTTGTTVVSVDVDCDDSGEAALTLPASDCNDVNAAINPAATEQTGDNVDQDCNSSETCYVDSDDDTYRTPTETTVVSADADCNDSGEALDSDLATDCNDLNAAINPAATEGTGDNVDQNCDNRETCYVDADNDTYRTTTGSTVVSTANTTCTDAGEAVATDPATDCNDGDSAINPAATEGVGDNVDQDCSGGETCYVDSDSDSYRNTTGTTVASADSDCTDAGEGLSSEPATDCADTNAAIHPGATEGVGDNVDQDCSGGETCYVDADSDSYRNMTGTTLASVDTDCADAGEGLATEPATDCNDANAAINPAASEGTGDNVDQNCDSRETCYVDADNDTYRTTTGSTVASSDADCNDSGEAVTGDSATDCNDGSATVYPGATETVGNSIDENCDGAETCYVDADSDNYRNTTGTTVASVDADCADAGEGLFSEPATDCNDASAAVHPGASETVGNGVDEDCSGGETCYVDADNDNYRTTTGSTVASADADCTDSGEAVSSDPNTDCNDSSATVHPGASETVGNGVDEDCSGGETCYVDADNDNYRTTTGSTVASADADCTDSGESISTDPATDCNDADATVHPGATEVVGDSINQTCDGTETCYVDSDSDNYRNTTGTTVSSADTDCTDAGEGLATEPATDCNDASATVHPGATETVGNGVDEDCSGGETCYVDVDNDNFRTTTGSTVASADADCTDSGEAVSTDPATDCNDANSAIKPGATELTGDSVDQNCDGAETCFVDVDNDNYRTIVTTTTVASVDTDCTDSGEAVATDPSTDCNDANASINPGAGEAIGDGVDQDCSGGDTCYVDADDDTYRPIGGATIVSGDLDCTDAGEAVAADPATDCDDASVYVKPGAVELCDGIKNDCNDAGWTASFEDGTASTVTTGVWADITASVAGSAGSPASYTLPTAATTTVWFCPGTFYVHLTATNSGSMVSGRGTSADVILDADGSGPVLDATGSSSSVLTLTDLTLTNGTGKLATDLYGGAIYATAASSHTGGTTMLVLDGCEVTNSAADYGGGIALANRASITLTDSRVYDNSAAINGGGLWIQQGAAICEATIAGSFGVYLNDAVTKGGGAFLANSNSATLDSVSCDWGTTLGVDENVLGAVANDVDVTYNGGGAVNSYAAYGANATFSCMGGGGSGGECAP